MRSGFPGRCEACVLNRNPAFRRAPYQDHFRLRIPAAHAPHDFRYLLRRPCFALFLRTTRGDDMDMRLKSQPSAVVSTIMYRPVASVKPYEFPLDNHGFRSHNL